MERAHHVAAVATEHRDETERGRRLARPVVDALRGVGALRARRADHARRRGRRPNRFVRSVLELAVVTRRWAGVTASSAGSNFLAALIPRAAAVEVFADVTQGGAGPFAPSGRAEVVDGGYVVSGRWPYSSNCQQAAVISAGMITFADGRPADDAGGWPAHPAGLLHRRSAADRRDLEHRRAARYRQPRHGGGRDRAARRAGQPPLRADVARRPAVPPALVRRARGVPEPGPPGHRTRTHSTSSRPRRSRTTPGLRRWARGPDSATTRSVRWRSGGPRRVCTPAEAWLIDALGCLVRPRMCR